MRLYELVGKDKEKGFSPFVWRIKMALAHKGLVAETIPLTFTEIKDAVAFAGGSTVPTFVDGVHIYNDSWDIACYLEEAYADRPTLFGGSIGKAQAKLFSYQIVKPLIMPLFRTIVSDIHNCLDEPGKDYFRKGREPRIGCTIEEARGNFEPSLALFKENLWPYQQCLKGQSFICGDDPAYSDYILYGVFQWARLVSPKILLEEGDTLYDWRHRMDQLYGGLGSKVSPIL
jgi:glutathione S-transferase